MNDFVIILTSELLGGFVVVGNIADVVSHAAQGHNELIEVSLIAETIRNWFPVRISVDKVVRKIKKHILRVCNGCYNLRVAINMPRSK